MRPSLWNRVLPALASGMAAVACLAGPAAGQTASGSSRGDAGGVRDNAGLFSPAAVISAEVGLEDFEKKTGWKVVIETVESLGGKPIEKAAVENAKKSLDRGVYVLIPKRERRTWVEPSRSARATFTPDRVKAVNAALTDAFKAGDFDRGLTDAVALIRETAGVKASSPATAAATPTPAPTPPAAATPPPPPAPRFDPTPPAEAGQPGPAPRPVPRPGPDGAAGGSAGVLGPLLLLGGAVLLGLWLVSKFRRPAVGDSQGGPGGARPFMNAGPDRNAATRPGQAEGPDPYRGQPYGAPPPPAGGGGGGFMSGVLGGLGGAVLGNALYDQFARPHASGAPAEPAPPAQGLADVTGAGAAEAPASYEQGAGTGGDWGAEPAAEGEWGDDGNDTGAAGDGGDWGDDPAADDGGDWGGSDDLGGEW